MKKITLTIIILLTAVFSIYAQQDSIPETDTTKRYFDTISRLNLGIYGTWNYNNISNFNETYFEDRRKVSFEFGMEVRYRLSKKISLDVGVGYSKLPTLNFKCEGCKFGSNDEELIIEEDKSIQYTKTSLSYSSLRFPIGIRYNFNDDSNNTLSVSGGVSFLRKPFASNLPQYSYRADTVFNIEEILPGTYKENGEKGYVMDLGYYFTVGKSFSALKNLNFQIELTYQYLSKYYYIRNSNLNLYGIKLELIF
jgi:hypothetical protein